MSVVAAAAGDDVSDLVQTLRSDADPRRREHALEQLRRRAIELGDPDGRIEAVLQDMASDPDDRIAEAAAEAISDIAQARLSGVE